MEIVNLKREKCDVRCDRTSILGNPFHIGRDGTRDEVCDKYKEYFIGMINKYPKFKTAVLSIRGKRCGCWCAPDRCHLEVIKEWLDNHL